MKPTSDKKTNELLRGYLEQGWVLEDRGKHLMMRSPWGGGIFFSRTPSDRRAYLNLRAQLRRAEEGRM